VRSGEKCGHLRTDITEDRPTRPAVPPRGSSSARWSPPYNGAASPRAPLIEVMVLSRSSMGRVGSTARSVSGRRASRPALLPSPAACPAIHRTEHNQALRGLRARGLHFQHRPTGSSQHVGSPRPPNLMSAPPIPSEPDSPRPPVTDALRPARADSHLQLRPARSFSAAGRAVAPWGTQSAFLTSVFLLGTTSVCWAWPSGTPPAPATTVSPCQPSPHRARAVRSYRARAGRQSPPSGDVHPQQRSWAARIAAASKCSMACAIGAP